MIYVVDSADRRRMEETSVELQQLLDEEKLAHVPVLLMANKQDLLNALSPAELTAELGLNDLRDRTWNILACSARTGEGLQEGMEWLVEQINSTKEVRFLSMFVIISTYFLRSRFSNALSDRLKCLITFHGLAANKHEIRVSLENPQYFLFHPVCCFYSIDNGSDCVIQLLSIHFVPMKHHQVHFSFPLSSCCIKYTLN